MTVALWITAVLLTVVYLLSGAMKVTQSREKLLANPQMGWVEDFAASTVRLIGALELLGAIGLMLPALTDIAPVLTPLAATGLALLQVGAMVTHLRRGEAKVLPVNVVLLGLAVFVAVGRF